MKKYKIVKNENLLFYEKIIISNIFIIIYILAEFNFYKVKHKYPEDDLTLVSAYYQIPSKHSHFEYLNWISNIVLLNKSFVFFTNKKFIQTLKKLRPINLHYKTVFIELELEDFYTYKNFYEEFNKSFYIDLENKYHTIPLYMIWAEKSMFLKKAIVNNYFNSKCFYWIDAGYFNNNKSEMKKYLNDWPSTKKCYEDKRVLFGQVKQFSTIDKQKIVDFDLIAHNNLKRNINVVGGLFGGQFENILKFIDIYYSTLKVFSKKNLFIGKDQNIYTYIAFAHPDVVNLVLFPNYRFFKIYLA